MITILSLLFAMTLTADVKQIAQRVDANVGVAAMDLDSGETFVLRGNDRFPLASVFKFPLAVEVLRRVDSGPLRLEQTYVIVPADFAPGHSPIRDRAKGKAVSLTLRELLTAAVSDSDNTAGDYLLRMVSPAAVTACMRTLGAGEFRINRPEKEIIESFDRPHGVFEYNQAHLDSTTPRAALALLRAVHSDADGLSPASHALLEDILTNSTNPVRIGKRLPDGCRVAHKTGTMPAVLNDIGIVTSPDGKHHIAIAIFTKNGMRAAEADREEVVAEIARAIYDEWTPAVYPERSEGSPETRLKTKSFDPMLIVGSTRERFVRSARLRVSLRLRRPFASLRVKCEAASQETLRFAQGKLLRFAALSVNCSSSAPTSPRAVLSSRDSLYRA